jgi:hypothetical protein
MTNKSMRGRCLAPGLLLMILPACVGEVGQGTTSGGGGSTGSPTGSGGAGAPGGGGAAAGGVGGGGTTGTVASGLPCDVAALISSKCVSCHGATPLAGVPTSLVSYADLTAPAKSDPTRTNAQVAVARMGSTTAPMPPAGATPATPAEIAVLDAWIGAGYPNTGCNTGGAGGAGGGGGTGGVVDPFAVAPTCTSKVTWTRGTSGSGSMQPGVACINCHTSSGGEAPRFTIAGTVYPTAHEPDQCNGASGTDGARVVVTGANGAAVTLTPNAAGNFYYQGTIATPFTAKVTYMGRERVMVAGQTSGDCNACHTQTGAMSAPGRILLP